MQLDELVDYFYATADFFSRNECTALYSNLLVIKNEIPSTLQYIFSPDEIQALLEQLNTIEQATYTGNLIPAKSGYQKFHLTVMHRLWKSVASPMIRDFQAQLTK